MKDTKNYFIDEELTGSIIFKDRENRSGWQVPRRLLEELKEQSNEEVLSIFNWLWKAYLKNQYTQQQFSRKFRKIVNSLTIEEANKEV